MLQREIIHRYKDSLFYLLLHMGSDVLHNCTMYSWESMNVMPLSMMRKLRLEVHRPYRNVRGLGSKAMHVHGLIKDMVFHLITSPDINTVMDILFVDLPPTYGMLLSCKFSASLGGTLQMDLSFTSISNHEGHLVKVLREPKKPTHVEKFLKQGNKVEIVA